jgi:hypothetical protein
MSVEDGLQASSRLHTSLKWIEDGHLGIGILVSVTVELASFTLPLPFAAFFSLYGAPLLGGLAGGSIARGARRGAVVGLAASFGNTIIIENLLSPSCRFFCSFGGIEELALLISIFISSVLCLAAGSLGGVLHPQRA